MGDRHRAAQLRHCARPRACLDPHRARVSRGACSRSCWPSASFDTGANALIAVATTHGSIGIVAVLSALYPITTILLARAVLHERLGPTRTAGGLIALGGAALIAAG